jgi:hypothetical protein
MSAKENLRAAAEDVFHEAMVYRGQLSSIQQHIDLTRYWYFARGMQGVSGRPVASTSNGRGNDLSNLGATIDWNRNRMDGSTPGGLRRSATQLQFHTGWLARRWAGCGAGRLTRYSSLNTQAVWNVPLSTSFGRVPVVFEG